MLDLADEMKADRHRHQPLHGPRAVALIFDKPTLRTQLSFAVGVAELGGHPLVDRRAAGRLGERESIADTTRVLARQVAAIVWRTFGQDRIEEMAAHSTVPVVNALTDQFHPCQILADLQTVREHKQTAAPGSRSPTSATPRTTWRTRTCSAAPRPACTSGSPVPTATSPTRRSSPTPQRIAADTGGSVTVTSDPAAAFDGADVVATDTWVSMGQEDEKAEREAPFRPFAVDADGAGARADDAIVLHCLPAYRGKEIAAEVIDGPQSVVWDEAENRLHAQKALLTCLLERS